MRSTLLGIVIEDAGELKLRDPFQPDHAPWPLRASASNAAAPGDWVLAQLGAAPRSATLHEVKATAGSALAHLYGIAADHGLNPVFPDEVEREVEQLVREPGLDDPALVDYRELRFVTIDGATSRDLDQAVHVERADSAGFLVRYAIADAAYYVRPGTALFEDALARGASYYLPGFMVPMLPRALSEGIISLNPDVERRAMVFEMRIDSLGRCVQTEIRRAKIRSHAKLAFERVQAFLDDREGAPFEDPLINDNLALLEEVGRLRMKDAEHRDVVRYRRTELGIQVGNKGLTLSVHLNPRVEVERYNEQCSLLCNVEGAKLLRDGPAHKGVEIQPIYRVHPSPDPEKVRRFEKMLAAMVRLHKLDASRFSWRKSGDVALADYLSQLPSEGEQGRLAQAIHRQAVMINLRSEFREEPGAHHGVGADVYARFSAPMREIVGVFLHKEMWELLSADATQRSALEEDEALRTQIVERSNEAKRIQSRINQLSHLYVLDQLFGQDLERDYEARTVWRGTVMGLTQSKVHVTFEEPPVDVKLYTDDLEEQLKTPVELCDDGASLRRKSGRGVCRIGEPVTVRVQRWDASRKRFVLRMEAIQE